MRRACLVLGFAAACVLPAPASAAVTMTDFRVEPASKQGGGHPDVRITQKFSYDNHTDSVRDAFVRLQPGLLGNPQSAGFCTQQQFTADSCPADSVVGSVTVEALAYAVQLPGFGIPTTSQGRVYNLRPVGDEPARLGIVVAATGNISKLFLQAPVYVRRGSDGYGLESTFADQPRDAGVPLQITEIVLTLNGRASKGSFMRMPTSCAEGLSVSRANSWEAPNTQSAREFRMTPTGCGSLGFAPRARGTLGAPGQTGRTDFPPLSTTLLFDPEEAALARAEVILPMSVQPNLAGAQRACLRPQADASDCSASSRVGTAIIDSPLQPQPVRGPVYIAFNSDATFPGLLVLLPAPVGVRLDGIVDSSPLGTRNTFASNPDLPVRGFTLEFEGGRPDAAVTLVEDLCSASAQTTIDVKLIAHNGKQSQFRQQLDTPGCDPRARFTLRRRGRTATLVARLSSTRDGPAINGFSLTLPRTLSRGTARPFVLAESRRVRARTRPRSASASIPSGARSVTIVWRGLRAGRRLRRSAVLRLAMTDTRDKTTVVKRRVRVRGTAPGRR